MHACAACWNDGIVSEHGKTTGIRERSPNLHNTGGVGAYNLLKVEAQNRMGINKTLKR